MIFGGIYVQLSLYASLIVMTSESASHGLVSGFSLHVIYCSDICHLTVAIVNSMIDKTPIGFNLYGHKNFLPSTLILYRLCENLSPTFYNKKLGTWLQYYECNLS